MQVRYLRDSKVVQQELAALAAKTANLQKMIAKYESGGIKTIADSAKNLIDSQNKIDRSSQKIEPIHHKDMKAISIQTTKDNQEQISVPTILSKNEQAPIKNQAIGQETLLLIIASSQRPDYLKKTLSYVLRYHPKHGIPVVVSQDGNNEAVNRVVSQAQAEFAGLTTATPVPFIHVHHETHQQYYENGYFKLADHFHWILDTLFQSSSSVGSQFQHINNVIILEEDLQIAPDFFDYFLTMLPFLASDHDLLTISAWNDNGFASLVHDNHQFFRSDFFPGLGWAVTRTLWTEELSKKWPKAYWDDWLREPKQRQNRQIIRPEISRTFHFGTRGVSNAQYANYLEQMTLNAQPVDYTALDLHYLTSTKEWETYFLTQVRQAQLITPHEFSSFINGGDNNKKAVKMVYSQLSENSHQPNSFGHLAELVGVMNNIKANVPRTAYRGIVTCWKGNVQVFLVPSQFQLTK